MKRIISVLGVLFAAGSMAVSATGQAYPFATDAQQRGYYNRPYQRYEAEPGWCTTSGQFLAATDDQRQLQSEASHQQAVQLTNPGDSVSWVVDRPGDGLTIRFSLPDNENGTGIVGYLDVYANGEQLGFIYLNSYWAWQYCDGTYPDNRPRSGNIVIRMRFDENHLRLSRMVQSGEVLTLRKNDQNTIPYTVDFIELEPVPAKVTFESLSGDKVQYDPVTSGLLSDFIRDNAGKTIYLPEGTIDCPKRIYLNTNNTKLIGAGMWYTQIYFSASSDNADTYSKRGIEATGSNLQVEGIYLNTANNKRYYNNDDSKQVGKGFMGNWGRNSVIRNCWVEHFECGAWIADYNGNGSDNLLFEHCRIRNNYADGINFSQYTKNHTARYCSFRNNGDDDMASWTSSGRQCSGMVYEYCTAENNWRASSLGFFGGKNLTGHHLHIVDGLESGLRVNADFPGGGFATDGQIYIHDVTVEHCGCTSGTKGQRGDFWGQYQPAVSVGAGNNYDIWNVTLEDVDVRDSRGIAVNVRAGNKKVHDTRLVRVHVDGATTAFQCTNGGSVLNTTYCELSSENVNNHMVGCSSWQQAGDCRTLLPSVSLEGRSVVKQLVNGQLVICVAGQRFNARGQRL